MLATASLQWVPSLLFAVGAIGVFVVSALILRPLIRAWVHGVRVGPAEMIGMRLRRTDPGEIVENLARARRAGLELSPRDLEAHALAGGNVEATVTAMIAAHACGLSPNWETLAAVDLRGGDVVRFVGETVRADRPADEPPTEAAPGPVGNVGVTEAYLPLPGRIVIDGQCHPALAQRAPIERGATVEVVDTMICLVVRPKGL